MYRGEPQSLHLKPINLLFVSVSNLESIRTTCGVGVGEGGDITHRERERESTSVKSRGPLLHIKPIVTCCETGREMG